MAIIATLLTISGCLVLLFISQLWWRSYLNPITLGILVWLPGMVMIHWPPFFLSPLYIHLNRSVHPLLYLALAIALASFWAGCALVKMLSKPGAFDLSARPLSVNVNTPRLLALFALGLALFAFSYLRSGLMGFATLDEKGVAEAQVSLHLGSLSFLMFFLNIGAIGFFARFLETGRWHFAIPMAIAVGCYCLTLQKSPVVQLLGACLVLAVLYPKASHYLLWRTTAHRAVIVGLAFLMVVTMLSMNFARGISAVQMTAAASPVTEQIYIYSGGSALMNMSTTIEGYLPSDPPTMGLYLARPLTWYLVDRSQFVAGAYVEGINAPTYLIYGWVDFRWFGFFILPLVTGILVMLFLRSALKGGLIQIMLGVTAVRVVIFSSATDVILDPTTWILLGVSLIAHVATRDYRAAKIPPAPRMRPARLPARRAYAPPGRPSS